jgi:hypothetical protein
LGRRAEGPQGEFELSEVPHFGELQRIRS